MEPGVGGQIRGISLDSFLQMAQMEKTTCTLTVSTNEEVGYLYILKGVLIAAETGDLDGKDSVFRILSWENVSIEIINTCEKTENEINQPLMNLLMEGLRLKDENQIPEPTMFSRPPEQPAAPSPSPDAEPISDYKDLSKPAEKIEHPPGPTEGEPVEKVEPPPKLPKKGFPAMAVVGVVVVLVLSVGGFVAFSLLKFGGVKKDFQQLQAQLEIQPELEIQVELLQNFVDSHEPGEFTAKAQDKIKEIRIVLEEEDFTQLTIAVSALPLDDKYENEATALYKQFLANYPDGYFAAEIRQKISAIPELIDDVDYKKVKAVEKSNFDEKVSVYSQYLEKHPTGKHRPEVETLISNMSEAYYNYINKEIKACNKQQEWHKCIELCSNFMTLFKDNPRLEEIVALKIKMQSNQDVVDLMQEAKKKGTDYLAAREIYMTYLGNHPDSIHKDRIISEVKKIDRTISEKADWEDIAVYSNNKKYDLSERVKHLEQYISKNPAGPYSQEAKNLLAQLKEEVQSTQANIRKEAAQKKELAKIQAEKDRIAEIRNQRLRQEQKMAALLSRTGGRFKTGNGTVTDTNSGLVWTLLDSHLDLGKCLNYRSAKNYVNELKTGGYADWRLPTGSELAGIYKNKPFFPSSGAAWYWTSEAYWKGYNEIANVVTTTAETIYKPEQKNQTECGAVRAVRP
jgi:hypothetical protein